MAKGPCVLYTEVFFYDELIDNCKTITLKSHCVSNLGILVKNIFVHENCKQT